MAKKKTTKRRAPTQERAPGSRPDERTRRPLFRLAEMQIASLASGVAVMSQWADLAARYAKDLEGVLQAVDRKKIGYRDAMDRAMRDYQRYLGQATDLPRIYALRFYTELARVRDMAPADGDADTPADPEAGTPPSGQP
jgi:hypothetical protein